MSRSKKLIEVALPLVTINEVSAREKSIHQGHPSKLHLWWSRKPLSTCRAVLFASLVDDPGSHPEAFPSLEAQEAERERLLDIMKELVQWENSTNEQVLEKARAEILRSTQGNPPPLLDNFCGGGSIPLEAQRLGLKAFASDLNPVAVLITKAQIEIPPRFATLPPVNSEARGLLPVPEWREVKGLARDVRYYGQWMRDEAEKRIGSLYPKATLPREYGGGEATIIAWLSCRTVRCPNPACGAMMPLASKFWLSNKAGKRAWVEPVVDRGAKTVRFDVRTGTGTPPDPPKLGRGASFRCLVCGQAAPERDIRAEFQAKRNGQQLMALVVEGRKGRVYLSADDTQIFLAQQAKPRWKPDEEMNQDTPNLISGRSYGVTHWHELFTPRQLVALTTFSDLVSEVRDQVLADAQMAGMPDDPRPLCDGGAGAQAYADAITTYLAFAVDRCADYWSLSSSWHIGNQQIRCTFARQAIAMSWDFAEANPFSNSSGGWLSLYLSTVDSFRGFGTGLAGRVGQADAMAALLPRLEGERLLISTDPPYYDNISYADLSDLFYIWLRRSLRTVYPDLFSTLLTPKTHELVFAPHRFGGDKGKARYFYEEGLSRAFAQMRAAQHPDYPLTVYYAYRQAETEDDEDAEQGSAVAVSTGWETMLEALLQAGFAITGTWPMRSEQHHRMGAHTSNVLASSIVLVCRPQQREASLATRREFLAILKKELPDALRLLQSSTIAPVDLAQASIGPGMAVFSRFSKVVEADGTPMRVRSALQIINQVLDEVLTEQEGEYDGDTRWAVAWFDQYAFAEGPYGEAETLSKAKNTTLRGLELSGILEAKGGKVRLLRREELPPLGFAGIHLPGWAATQQLIQALKAHGEEAAARVLREAGASGYKARDLAYRLYTTCERKRWAQDALDYNSSFPSCCILRTRPGQPRA